jgi:hypothetical protein
MKTHWNHTKHPDAPLRWRKPRQVRVTLTGAETDGQLDRMMATMAVSPRGCFQLLAPIGRMHKYLTELTVDGGPVPARWDDARRPAYNAVHWRQREYIGILGAYPKWPLPNVAIGTICCLRCPTRTRGCGSSRARGLVWQKLCTPRVPLV